ncbi:hypothetical protein EDF56_106219 [Novosphingobium sp. PhB165]|uniref:hypothetical protein n=1 Tax=Novosphingobium sp. PhB165 TaxID=2485105 RepID=UPI00104CFA7C|nr:hypothetical protein [Novosphingobium sp. PhB165]TCM17103.1 hypothetical protein EDF56_106219 [Novosphingobium sp. PhB165]
MRGLTPQEREPVTALDWREGNVPRVWFAVLVLLACLPLIVPHVPPLTDLPAHMSRFMVQQDAGRSADIARWFHFEWNLIPNLGTDLVAFALEPLIGLTLTMKAIAVLIVALQTAGYLLLSRAAHGRVVATALFALPLAYGNPFEYGFLNFTFATALSTLALALWISPWAQAQPRRRWLVFAAIASVIWISHLAAWAMLCVMVGCCELTARWQRTERFWHALLTGFLACTCLLTPQALSLLWPHTPAHLPSNDLFNWTNKLYFMASVLADRWNQFDTFCALGLLIVAVLMAIARPFALHRGLALAALMLTAIFCLMPGRVYGSYYADMRMVPTIFALALIAARPAQPSRDFAWLTLAGLAFFGLRLIGTTTSMALWDRQIRQETEVLNALPRGSQLVTFTALPCRTFVLQGHERNMHIASYALLRRHAFANDQFAMSGGQLLSIDNPAAAPFDRDPSAIEIGETCQGEVPVLTSAAKVAAAIPNLWIVWQSTQPLPVPGWVPVARSGEHGHSILYRRAAE